MLFEQDRALRAIKYKDKSHEPKVFFFSIFFSNRALRAIKYKDKSHEPDDLMTWIDAKLKSVKAQEANLDSEFAALMH